MHYFQYEHKLIYNYKTRFNFLVLTLQMCGYLFYKTIWPQIMRCFTNMLLNHDFTAY